MFFPGSRATAPMPLEGRDSDWQRFELALDQQKQSFAATMTAEAALRLDQQEQAQRLRNPTLDDVMAIARRNHRSAPLPLPWTRLHALLPTRGRLGIYRRAPAAYVGSRWSEVAPMEKRLRLREQIVWAASTGALPAVYDLLFTLPEEAWGHF